VRVESVQKRAIIEHLGWNVGNVGPCAGSLGFVDSALDDRVDDEVCFWNLDVLLEMQKRELELGKLFLGHWDSHLGVRAILAAASCAYKGVEPRLYTAADDGVKALVWSFIAAEEIEEM
jgi:hypothetical protein